MCGIAGFIDFRSRMPAVELIATVQKMSGAMFHRGPDDSGAWTDENCGVALGHRRLSIIDLSPEGHQPMLSACGRYVIAFNGEIYNFLEIRKELENSGEAPAWRGHSDTEVMLAAIACWGIEKALQRFNGMFAFALLDRHECLLYLCRDRVGKKPLYYGWNKNVFLFGSELKALRAYPGWHCEISRNSIALLLRHNYIPAPYSIYKDIFKLLPGSFAVIRTKAIKPGDVPEVVTFWSAKDTACKGMQHPFDGSDEEAVMQLDTLLRDAVRLRMLADVPLGAFLSGGIDSSVIVALMQTQSSRPVRTFTIGFHEETFDESRYAKAIASHLNTEHTELYISSRDALNVVPRLPQIFDEPFADSSQIPTFLVSELARRHVTVSLSGDGGDELFGGYSRYLAHASLWDRISRIPSPLRKAIFHASNAHTVPWGTIGNFFHGKVRRWMLEDYRQRAANMLVADSIEAFYYKAVSQTDIPHRIATDSRDELTAFTDRTKWASLSDVYHKMMYMDSITYLPDDILVKVDRASMGVSLETRVPFLDHRVVEFAWRIPLHLKIRNGKGKWILRKLLTRYVPEALFERPKKGFSVPLEQWLRGPLREWAENLISESRLKDEGFFDSSLIRQKWDAHISNNENWADQLWAVLTFQSWLDSLSE